MLILPNTNNLPLAFKQVLQTITSHPKWQQMKLKLRYQKTCWLCNWALMVHRLRSHRPSPRQYRYAAAAVLDLMCLSLILAHSGQAIKLLSPIVAISHHTASTVDIQGKLSSFAFVPGWDSSKFESVQLTGVKTLAFFDVPILEDGTLFTDSTGYYNFHSSDAQALFSRAHNQGTKVLLTLTPYDNQAFINLLTDPQVQQAVVSEAKQEIQSTGIDGVAIDFEAKAAIDPSLGPKYTDFVKQVSQGVHQSLPNATVAVALPDVASGQAFYNVSALAQETDQLDIIAYTFAVQENKNSTESSPTYGVGQDTYWQDVSKAVDPFLSLAPSSKLELEIAWYGNGDSYPLYVPNDQPSDVTNITLTSNNVNLDQNTLNNLVSAVPADAQAAARQNIPYIVSALKKEGILNSDVLAYALATIEHETAGTFQPIDEIQGRMSARRLGYEGGADYFGRGFIQLTHLRNYLIMGERIGLGTSLAEHPELASRPDIAARILAAYFKDNNIANLASAGDFVDARTPINPDNNGYLVAGMAMQFLDALFI